MADGKAASGVRRNARGRDNIGPAATNNWSTTRITVGRRQENGASVELQVRPAATVITLVTAGTISLPDSEG
jgi:hypothetical protein